MNILLILIFAHLLGDFVLQPEKWVRDKAEHCHKSVYLYLHTGVHTLLLFVVLHFEWSLWPIIAIISGSHYFIDLGKSLLSHKTESKVLFFVDQGLHVAVLVVVSHVCFSFSIPFEYVLTETAVLLVVALIGVTRVSSIIMMLSLASWKFEDEDAKDSLKHAGKYIGVMERLFVFGFIVLNQWQAIGWLMAAKSVFRFNDLSRARDRKLTEYFLIGTLVSFGLAIVWALLYLYFKPMVQ